MAYLIGSIPFGVLISKLHGIDIQNIGSGNMGATNVFRNVGAIPGITVFSLDVVKGAIPVFLASIILPSDLAFKHWIFIMSGAFAVLGHMYPIYLRFKGGKGGATSLGVLIGIMPDVAIIAAFTFIAALLLTRYVSVGTMTTAVASTMAMWLTLKPNEYLIFTAIVTILIIFRHSSNVKRIFAGTEPKVGR